jgi:protein-S-isoprenylcysteine O-methyltransferase Ste14
MAFAVVAVAATIFRLKPIRSAGGFEPRFTALSGTFLLLLLVLIPPHKELPPVLIAVALSLLIGGTLLAVYVLSWLGRSFSIMAQARKLVTSGPYSFVRHPLYVTEEIATIGLILLICSWKGVVVGLIHWGIQLRRMFNEEKVLRQTFPEYDAYANCTPRIIPRLSRFHLTLGAAKS